MPNPSTSDGMTKSELAPKSEFKAAPVTPAMIRTFFVSRASCSMPGSMWRHTSVKRLFEGSAAFCHASNR